MKRFTLFVLFALIGFSSTLAQVSKPGTPPSFSWPAEMQTIDFLVMPPIDLERLNREDLTCDTMANIPWRFAEPILVDLNPQNSGTWHDAENGDRIWRLGVRSPGAYTLNLIFNNYVLPEGAELYVYNTDHSRVLGAFTDYNNQEDHYFATTLVEGDELVVEYFEPHWVEFPGELRIERVNHDYRDFFASVKGFGQSLWCNKNVACPEAEGWEKQIRSVALLFTNGNELCSASLINNTANDGRPFLLSASHCFQYPGTLVAWFNWQSETCENPEEAPSYDAVGGLIHRARYAETDFWLLEFNQPLPDSINPYFAGWNRSMVEELRGPFVGIHHPRRDIKKFRNTTFNASASAQFDAPGTGTEYWSLSWSDGSAGEGGSSGSPLFDSKGRILGQLLGFNIWGCSTTSVNWYGRLGSSWTGGGTTNNRLSDWLDPLGLDVQTISGFGGNLEPPFTENFDTTPVDTIPPGWTTETNTSPWFVLDGGGHSYPNSLYKWFDETEPLNDWVFTPGIELTEGISYNISFYIFAPGWQGVGESLALWYGDAPDSEHMTVTLYDNPDIRLEMEKILVTFSVSSTGVYYFGWHAYSPQDLNGILIDDVDIRETPELDLNLSQFYQSLGLPETNPKNNGPDIVPNGFFSGLSRFQKIVLDQAVGVPASEEAYSEFFPAFPVSPRSINPADIEITAIIENPGIIAADYLMNWAVDGIDQTPISGPIVNAGESDTQILVLDLLEKGTYLLEGTLEVAGDEYLLNNYARFNLCVYPEHYERTFYDRGTNLADTYVGFGDTEISNTQGVRFTADGYIKPIGVEFKLSTEMATEGTFVVQIRAAGSGNNAPGPVLYSAEYSTPGYFSPYGDMIFFAFDENKVPVFAPGTNYWITVKCPAGSYYPGAVHAYDIVPNRSYIKAPAGETWYQLIVAGYQMAWIMRSVHTEAHSVTFNVDMTYAEEFEPESDIVYLTGDLMSWAAPGDEPDEQTMSRVDESMVWTKTLHLLPGTYAYKYFLNGGWDGGEWQGGTDRALLVESDLVVNDWFGSLTDPTIVTDPVLSGIRVYPVPARNTINILSPEVMRQINIVDLLGQVVYTANVVGMNHQVNVSGFKDGMYFIQVFTATQTETFRVQVKK